MTPSIQSVEQLEHGDLQFNAADGSVFLVSVYEVDLIRVRWLPHGAPGPHMLRTWSFVDKNGECPMEGHRRHNLDALGRFSRPKFGHVPEADKTRDTLDTGILRIDIMRDPFTIVWSESSGQPLAADNALIGYVHDPTSGRIAHTLTRKLDDEHYYGFGEKAGPLDKHSRRMKMRNTDAFGYDAETGDPLYKHIPFYITLRGEPGSIRAFGLFYDTPYDCEFDMGAEIDNYYDDFRVFRAEGGDLDYWFIYGPSIEQVVEKYTALTGRMPLPPRWTLGYLGNGMRYPDAPNAQEVPAEFIAKLRRYDVPCSGFNMGSGYTRHADGKRYVFTWARDRIPDPARMLRLFKEAGLNVVANVKPAMLTTHPRFDEARSLFIRRAESDEPDLAPFWGGQGAHLDFTNPATFAWWKANLKAQVLGMGFDFPWNDNNEYNVRHDRARCNGFGHEMPLAALRPIQTMLMGMASYQAVREHTPERRPWVLTRAAAPGLQRYAHSWTGDNRTSWKTLKYNIPMGLGLGLSGWANIGHDIGGFAGKTPSSELFLRWVQNGIFHPRFSINSWRQEGPEEAPWMHLEVLPQVREALRFRYRLLPYLYSLMWEAAQTGHPAIRPTVYHFADDPETHTQSFEFMLGPSLLVASVFEPGAVTRTLYLPAGTGWYDWHTGAFYQGGQVVTLDAPLDRFTLLAREGALIPLDIDGRRVIHAFPHRAQGVGEFTLFEDDGETLAYQRGQYRLIRLRIQTSADRIALSSDAHDGVAVEWRLPPHETRPIQNEAG